MLLGYLKVKVSLHTTAVYVSRHGVPYTTGSQLGHTHLNLAGGEHLIDEHLVDVTVVGTLKRTHVGYYGIGLGHLLARIAGVCGA